MVVLAQVPGGIGIDTGVEENAILWNVVPRPWDIILDAQLWMGIFQYLECLTFDTEKPSGSIERPDEAVLHGMLVLPPWKIDVEIQGGVKKRFRSGRLARGHGVPRYSFFRIDTSRHICIEDNHPEDRDWIETDIAVDE